MRRVFTLALVLFFPTAALGREPARRHSDSGNYSFLFDPSSWEDIPNDVVSEQFSALQEMAGGTLPTVTYEFALQHVSAVNYFDFPYCMVASSRTKVDSGTPNSWKRRIRSELGETLENSGVKDFVSDFRPSPPEYNEARHQLSYKTQLTIQRRDGPSKMVQISAIFFGNERIVTFNCYSDVATIESYNPVFEALFQSFAFDPGYMHLPSRLDRILPAALTGAALALLYPYISKRRKKRREAENT